VIIAEPKALIGFAGPRVIEQTIRQKLPKDFQRSEFLVEHGMLDAVVDRREMRDAVIRLLQFMYNPEMERPDIPVELLPEAALQPQTHQLELPGSNGEGARPSQASSPPAEKSKN
jgi:hypothetical protein